MGLVKDYLTSRTRPLTAAEVNDARLVYQRTIKFDRVMVADDLGARSAQWTEPSGGPMDLYILHMGPIGFASTDDPNMRAILIHELCHVWQGMNHIFSWGYVVGSLLNQAIYGLSAYDYTPGDLWGEYNVEQQAHIVEDWYRGGLRTDSPLYRYITGNIRCPVRSWFGETLTELAVGASAMDH